MRTGYWWIEAVLGALLIVAPLVWRFTTLPAATYTDVIMGILVMAWALIGYLILGRERPQSPKETHA